MKKLNNILFGILIAWAVIFLLNFTVTVFNDTVKLRIAVIDSGLNPHDRIPYCNESDNRDLTETSIVDKIHHGEYVNRIISDNARNPFCLVVIKYFDRSVSDEINQKRFLEALVYVKILGVDIINISSGGSNYSQDEYDVIKSMPNTIVVSAAGNNNQNLDEMENTFYPAMYKLDNIIVVGALDILGNRLSQSNYGNIVKKWQLGLYKDQMGTSFAVPRQIVEIINGQ